jgi:hypothetical protein
LDSHSSGPLTGAFIEHQEQDMIVGIAADHGGWALKGELDGALQEAGHELVDFGAFSVDPADDYPDFVIPLARAVANSAVERARARQWAKTPRRDIWFRVFPIEDYIRGAYALAAIARISISGGNTWGHTLARDAAMLASEAEATLRLGGIDRLNAGDIRYCKTKDGRIYLEVDVTMRKVHRDRIARIFYRRTIELLAPYLDVSPASAVFCDINGHHLGYLGIVNALYRTARVTVVQKGGANIMRRAGVFGNVPPEQRRKRLGHGKGSKVTKDYIPPRPDFSMALLHQTVTEAKAHHAQSGN